jgi:hypothetical protein
MLSRISIVVAFLALAQMSAVAQDNGPQAVPVCEGAFTIPARRAKTCTFVVTDGEHHARLEGRFSATGGPRNSIIVWVMNDDEFVNWRNHHPARSIYNSEKVTQGSVRVLLADPGRYHVVFNNEFSLITPKAVESSMTLHFVR